MDHINITNIQYSVYHTLPYRKRCRPDIYQWSNTFLKCSAKQVFFFYTHSATVTSLFFFFFLHLYTQSHFFSIMTLQVHIYQQSLSTDYSLFFDLNARNSAPSTYSVQGFHPVSKREKNTKSISAHKNTLVPGRCHIQKKKTAKGITQSLCKNVSKTFFFQSVHSLALHNRLYTTVYVPLAWKQYSMCKCLIVLLFHSPSG